MLHQTSGRIHNKNVSTHLIGNIKRGEGVGRGRLLRATVTVGEETQGFLSFLVLSLPPSLPALGRPAPHVL